MDKDKWLIETAPGQFQKASGSLTVDSGTLFVRPSIWDKPTLVLAVGQWLSVVRDDG